MSKLTPVDIAMLAMESPSRQMNIAFVEILEVPDRLKKNFVSKVLAAFRSSEVAPPFNQKLEWHKGVPSLETVETDLKYHVRHIAVPAPGKAEKLYEIISFLNAPLLDRARPLWECYVIEGLEGDQVGIFYKIHHALLDGAKTVELFQKSLSTSARDRSITPIWSPFKDSTPEAKRPKTDGLPFKKLVQVVGDLSHSLSSLSSDMAKLGGFRGNKRERGHQFRLGANDTLLNNLPTSSARRYANCQIPLPTVAAIAKQTGTTINDVMLTVIDHGLQQYLKEHGAGVTEPLVALMPISVRADTDTTAGNQIAVELVQLGEPDARIRRRLSEINESTTQAKSRSKELLPAVRQIYSLAVMASGILPDLSEAMRSLHSSNLIVSNVVGPQQQFYLAGAPVVSMQALPILPPGHGLNVTFASFNNFVALAVGAAPEAVDDPYHLTQLFLRSLTQLKKAKKTRV